MSVRDGYLLQLAIMLRCAGRHLGHAKRLGHVVRVEKPIGHAMISSCGDLCTRSSPSR